MSTHARWVVLNQHVKLDDMQLKASMKSLHDAAAVLAVVDPLTATHMLAELTVQRRGGHVSFANARHGKASAWGSAQVPFPP